MAQPEHWNVNPFDENEINLKTLGRIHEDRAETERLAKRLIPGSGGHALEIGAGTGRFMKLAARNFHRVTGVDSSSPIVARSNWNLWDYPRCRVILTEGVLLPFEDLTFDYAYSFTCFQHMPTLAIVRSNLREILRVLRPNNCVTIQTVMGDPNDRGRYDGVVFPHAETFALLASDVGFRFPLAYTEGEWIWLTAAK